MVESSCVGCVVSSSRVQWVVYPSCLVGGLVLLCRVRDLLAVYSSGVWCLVGGLLLFCPVYGLILFVERVVYYSCAWSMVDSFCVWGMFSIACVWCVVYSSCIWQVLYSSCAEWLVYW